MLQKSLTLKLLKKQFENAPKAWFWALSKSAQESTDYVCSGLTICRLVDRLYRQKILTLDHYRVLYFYGLRGSFPDRKSMKQERSCALWDEAMTILTDMMVKEDYLLPQHQNVIDLHTYQERRNG